MTIFLINVLLFLAGALAMGFLWNLVATHQRLNKLEKQSLIDGLPERKHYSYSQVAAIHDAIAVLVSAKADNDAERARMDTALLILATLYKNPGSYDPERPNNRQ
jgi:hypothetical protein